MKRSRHLRKKIAALRDRITSTAGELYQNDFLLTWEKTEEQLVFILELARILQALRDNNISTRLFDSGMAVSQFRDKSTRTRFSFASACNLLGLAVQELEEEKSAK